MNFDLANGFSQRAPPFSITGGPIASCCLPGMPVKSAKDLVNRGQAFAATSTSACAARVWVYSSELVRVGRPAMGCIGAGGIAMLVQPGFNSLAWFMPRGTET